MQLQYLMLMSIRNNIIIALCLLFFASIPTFAQIKLGLLVYNGGGDWYANPTALKNLAQFCNTHLNTNLSSQEAQVKVGSEDIFNYPFIHMTGHGRFFLSSSEAQNLRLYLESGGFLHIDDNYGLNDYVRSEMKKVFPDLDFVELPFIHPIYHQTFKFPQGLPKIHEHDGEPQKGYGLIYKGRLVCYYTYSTDLGDGWEDAEVHNNPEPVRLKALQMGANIIEYVFQGKSKGK
jgi:hypothetical protein